MLCNKLHHQIFLRLKLVSHKIGTDLQRRERALLELERNPHAPRPRQRPPPRPLPRPL